MYEPSSGDILMLIHKATLELYGIELDVKKTAALAGLITAVANGERTFYESDNEDVATKLKAHGEAEGIDMDELFREARLKERNAARLLRGLPLLER